jgi:uncharacterized SAM-binding protein YcdF (DUF218 family)
VADQTPDSMKTGVPRSRVVRWLKGHWRTWLLGLLIWMLLAPIAAVALIVTDPPPRPADAMVVLSGSSAYTERIAQAARLYRAGLAPDVLLTNDGQISAWSTSEGGNPFFYERAADELSRLGVPRDRIHVLPELVYSTYDEARRLRQYVCSERLHSLIVVTSAYHTRRTRWVFEAVLPAALRLEVSPAPLDVSTTLGPQPAFWWVRESGWRRVGLEYLKAAVYRIRYPEMRGEHARSECS